MRAAPQDSARRRDHRVGAWLQRLFVLAALVILAAPMVVQFAVRSEPRRGENRAPAARPAWPASVGALPAWTAGMDAWLRDHFGFRNRTLDALDQVQFQAFRAFTSPQIVMGREGRIFLASHDARERYRNSLIRVACGAGVPAGQTAQIAAALAAVLERSDAAGAGRSMAVLVPSASVLYPSQLPAWLERQCRSATPLIEGITAALPAAMAPRVVNLRPVLAALDPATPAIPRYNFHWDGIGPLRAAAWMAETQLGRRAGFILPTRVVRKRSDLKGFYPGLRLSVDVTEADEGRAGVATCLGPRCFEAALGAEAAVLMDELARYEGPGQEGRLLLLTDSFGAFVAAGFTPYFREVVQVSLNNLPQLSGEQRARLRRALLEEYRPDVTLFLVHDYAATYAFDIMLRDLLPGRP